MKFHKYGFIIKVPTVQVEKIYIFSLIESNTTSEVNRNVKVLGQKAYV